MSGCIIATVINYCLMGLRHEHCMGLRHEHCKDIVWLGMGL